MHSRKRFYIGFLIVLLTQPVSASYDFNRRMEDAYVAVMKLRFDEAGEIIAKERSEYPENDISLLLLNYIDFLKAFISEEKNDWTVLKKNTQARLKEMNARPGNENSPFHLYANAEMILQDAMVRVKFKEYVSAANDIRKAYRLVEKNKRRFPTFPLNMKLSGFLHTLVGAVPGEYRWLVDLVGMEGTIPQGTDELNRLYELLENDRYAFYREEILFYLSNIHSTFSNRQEYASVLLERMRPYTATRPLLRFCFANVAMKTGRNDEAINVLTQQTEGSHPFYFLAYRLGLAKLRTLDTTAATDFRYFLEHFKGGNYVKAAWQKLAWIELLKGNNEAYAALIKNCIENGVDMVDEDREALNEAQSKEQPNLYLLRSRLLFDGGYYSRASAQITGKSINLFPRYRDQLEVTYRLARILHKTGNTEKAIEYFKQTLKNGSASWYHFAANSALLLGNIYEERGNLTEAEKYFRNCLSLRKHEYQNSIGQKARAGLDRIAASKKSKP